MSVIKFDEFESVMYPILDTERDVLTKKEKFESCLELRYSIIGAYEYRKGGYNIKDVEGKYFKEKDKHYYSLHDDDFVNISYDPVFFIPTSMELRDYMPMISIDESNYEDFYRNRMDESYNIDDDTIAKLSFDMKKFADMNNTLIVCKISYRSDDTVSENWNSIEARANLFKSIGFSEFFMSESNNSLSAGELLDNYNSYTEARKYSSSQSIRMYLVYKNEIGKKYLTNNKKILERYIIEKAYIDNLRRYTYMSNRINPDI